MVDELHRNFITPLARANYVHVFEKTEFPNGDMGYGVALCIPKKDKKGIVRIKKAIKSAIISKWGKDKKKWPKKLDIPLRDGDKEKPDNEGYTGCMYLNTKNTKRQPGIVGRNGKPIMNEEDLYSGCYVIADIDFYPYKHSKTGKTGVGVGLSNIMKRKDGERLDGGRSAEKAFADYIEEDIDNDDDDFLDD